MGRAFPHGPLNGWLKDWIPPLLLARGGKGKVALALGSGGDSGPEAGRPRVLAPRLPSFPSFRKAHPGIAPRWQGSVGPLGGSAAWIAALPFRLSAPPAPICQAARDRALGAIVWRRGLGSGGTGGLGFRRRSGYLCASRRPSRRLRPRLDRAPCGHGPARRSAGC